MKRIYIKPETTEVQTICEGALMAATGGDNNVITTIADDEDYATEASFGKESSGMSGSLWDE